MSLPPKAANLIICSRRQDKLDAVAEEIEERNGTRVAAIAGDLSQIDDIQRIVDHGIERFGQYRHSRHKHWRPAGGKVRKSLAAAMGRQQPMLLTSVVELTRLLLPGMKERGWGRILNITSIAAKQPVENLILSNSLRAAVTGFAKTFGR